MKLLLNGGLLNGDCLTVTGKTIRESLKDLPGPREAQQIVRVFDRPLKATVHIRILKGNLAPKGVMAKITGKEGLRFSGPAKVYDSEEEMLHALERDVIDVELSNEELAGRKRDWQMAAYKADRGTLANYWLVKNARDGCVTDEP